MHELVFTYVNENGVEVTLKYNTLQQFIEIMNSDSIDLPMLDYKVVEADIYYDSKSYTNRTYNSVKELLEHCVKIMNDSEEQKPEKDEPPIMAVEKSDLSKLTLTRASIINMILIIILICLICMIDGKINSLNKKVDNICNEESITVDDFGNEISHTSDVINEVITKGTEDIIEPEDEDIIDSDETEYSEDTDIEDYDNEDTDDEDTEIEYQPYTNSLSIVERVDNLESENAELREEIESLKEDLESATLILSKTLGDYDESFYDILNKNTSEYSDSFIEGEVEDSNNEYDDYKSDYNEEVNKYDNSEMDSYNDDSNVSENNDVFSNSETEEDLIRGYKDSDYFNREKEYNRTEDNYKSYNNDKEFHAALGIRVYDYVDEESNDYEGVKVEEVLPESDLYGRLESGDIITEINGIKIDGAHDLTEYIKILRIGERVIITYMHDNVKITESAKLVSYNIFEE